MTDLQKRLADVRESLPAGVQLVAVSKFHSAALIREAYDAGQRVFGESHVQELQEKRAMLPFDIEWHFIGHLQTNKVKYIAPYVALIHAVDSVKLLHEIEKQAIRCERQIPCLLELHVADEATKYGFTIEQARALLLGNELQSFPHVQVRGLMCMATNTDDTAQIHREFASAYALYQEVKAARYASDDTFYLRSWGMSHDYHIATQEGSNMVRVGSSIFGPRQY